MSTSKHAIYLSYRTAADLTERRFRRQQPHQTRPGPSVRHRVGRHRGTGLELIFQPGGYRSYVSIEHVLKGHVRKIRNLPIWKNQSPGGKYMSPRHMNPLDMKTFPKLSFLPKVQAMKITHRKI